MQELRVTVVNRLGLHARAAARLVRAASAFSSDVRIERADRSASADAKSILSVLMLAASRGTELLVRAEGADEADALRAVCELIAGGFGEGEAGGRGESAGGRQGEPGAPGGGADRGAEDAGRDCRPGARESESGGVEP